MKRSIAYDKAFKFSVRIVKLYKYLCSEKKEFVLSKQILRSGTSIGANLKEGLYGQSKKDFISKLSISLKEAAETEYWIDLLFETDYIEERMAISLKNDLVEIIKILTSSLKTSKNNLENN
jgi:four helix bundle protein